MSGAGDREQLREGLARAGLERDEVAALLAYSDEIDRTYGPAVLVELARRRRARWSLVWGTAAAALLLGMVALAWSALLLARQNEELRGERARLSQELAATRADRARPVRAAPPRAHDLWRMLGESIAQGDPRALELAKGVERLVQELAADDPIESYARGGWVLVWNPRLAGSSVPTDGLLDVDGVVAASE
jgi:hypothetical protein